MSKYLVIYEDENGDEQACFVEAPSVQQVAEFHQFKANNWTIRHIVLAGVHPLEVWSGDDLEQKLDINGLDVYHFDDPEDGVEDEAGAEAEAEQSAEGK
jgi:hypothetical protein